MSQRSPTPPNSPYNIFISYRRDDTKYSVGHIYDRLKTRFGEKAIFIDVKDIPPGYVFDTYIHHVLQQCRVALIIIGKDWSTIAETRDNSYKGQARLSNPADHVRIETEQALSLAAVDEAGAPIGNLRLIPLLVQSAQMPGAEQLPESLRSLARFNSATVKDYPDFDDDIEQLIAVIASWIGITPSIPMPAQPQHQMQPPTTEQEMLAHLLPQLRADFEKHDWYQVRGKAKKLQEFYRDKLDDLPTEVFAMQGQARLMQGDYAKAKASWDVVTQRNPLDRRAWQAAAEARVRLGEWKEALTPLDNVVTYSKDDAEKLPALRALADAVATVARAESGDDAKHDWWRLVRVINEGLRLAGDEDADWLALKMEDQIGLEQDAEALEVARRLTARPDATAAQWLSRARLAWKLAGETPTDEVRTALDAASRLDPNEPAVTQARQQMFVLMPDRFPQRLAELGFAAKRYNGLVCIVPPVSLVAAGEFLMGSDKRHDNQADDDELPQHRVTLATYSIARFPVTVAEYACFVAAQAYPQPEKWAIQLQKLDHPVTWVSWDDAVAYAAWLAQTTQQPWRLPTEAEWEKAARWDARAGVARLYPWGDSFEQSRANTREGSGSGTTAVGSYPSGASLYGAEEMAGNIWEWTHTLFKRYPYSGSDGREDAMSTERRVLRGGSWGYLRQLARAGARYLSLPGYHYVSFGFRLALTEFIV